MVIVATDVDGTVISEYGKPIRPVVKTLKRMHHTGDEIIAVTMRDEQYLVQTQLELENALGFKVQVYCSQGFFNEDSLKGAAWDYAAAQWKSEILYKTGAALMFGDTEKIDGAAAAMCRIPYIHVPTIR